MTTHSQSYKNPNKIIDPFLSSKEFIKCLYLDPKLPRDYFVEYKPSDIAQLPANCFWEMKGEPVVIVEKSYDGIAGFDPTMPSAYGAIRFPTKSGFLFFKKKTESKWQALGSDCRFFTPASAYWDISNPPDNVRENFDLSEKDFVTNIFAGKNPATLNNVSPVEFGHDLAMKNYEETVTRTKTLDLVKSLKSLHLWALGIMVVGLLMLILLTAGGGGTT